MKLAVYPLLKVVITYRSSVEYSSRRRGSVQIHVIIYHRSAENALKIG
jgi:hypothetical protein